jgi:diguanylate cyclase (GGDEF)-like protein/PAS domain S-box-containing protein
MSRRIFRYLAGTAVVLCAIFVLLAAIVLSSDPSAFASVSIRWLLLGVASSTLCITLSAVWYVARSFEAPIETLTAALERLAGGDYDAPPLTSGTDGPKELVGAFDEMQQQLKASVITRDYLDRLLSSIRDAIIVIDPNEDIVRVNAAAASLLDYSDDALIGAPLTTVVDKELVEPDEDDSVAKPIDGVFRRRDGSPIAVSYTISDVHNDRGELEGRIVAAQNVAERRRVEQRIRYLARTDSLTKMPNRMQFQHQLQQAIARAKRTNQYLALLYMDIDRFKDINDTFGHGAGDTSLEIFAQRIMAELPEGATAGRLAGDEFAVILSGYERIETMTDAIASTSEALLAAIGRPFHVQGEEIFITTSVGVAYYPDDGDNVIDLIRNGDAALYQAKKAGGNCLERYSPVLNTAAVERLMLKSKLRRAFEREELRLHYQPKYNLASGRIEGVEALVRWDLPERGLVFPSDFIPLAEETNLILQVGDWVLNRVCEDYRLWQRTLPSPGRVSVNLSLKQLQQQRFLEKVRAIFKKHGVSPTCLELEITETTLMDDADRTIRILDSLYGMGLHLAIDDFGTGYSSLSALQQFPISTLKIDKSFVRDVADDQDDATIVATIIKMARSLNMDVVAEGVQAQEQLEFLREHECDYVQGHLFGDPVTAEGLLELLIEQEEGSNHYQTLFASR